MGTKFDDAKSRANEAAKETVGDAIDDPDLRREDELDRSGASFKERVERVVDEMKEKLNDVLSMGGDGSKR